MRLRRLLVLLSITLLGACATIPETSIEALRGEVPEGSGLVIAETVTHGERITGYVRYWTEIIFWRQNYEGEDTTFTITSHDHSLSTQVYMGALPAGEYRVGMLYATLVQGDITYYARALAPPALGSFEVREGQVTNLGTIIYQPFQDRNRIEAVYPDYAMTRVANDRLMQTFSVAYPDIAANYSAGGPALGWSKDSWGDQRDAAAALMKAGAVPRDVHALADGGTVASGHLGGIYLHQGGKWLALPIDENYRIYDVAQLPTGEFLIGGELGTFAVSSPLGENVTHITLDKASAHVLNIELSAGGTAYVLAMHPDGYNIYRYDPASQSLSVIRRLPSKRLGLFEAAYHNYDEDLRHPKLVGVPGGLSVYFESRLHSYSESDEEWSVSETPEYNAMRRQRDGFLSATRWSGWDGTQPQEYSTDHGETWIRTEETIGFFGSAPAPTYRFADGSFIRTGEDIDLKLFSFSPAVVLDEVPVLTSTDDGATWTPISSVPRGCVTISIEVSTDENVQILCANGGILSSEDRGQTWGSFLAPRTPDFGAFPGNLKVMFQTDQAEEEPAD